MFAETSISTGGCVRTATCRARVTRWVETMARREGEGERGGREGGREEGG